MKEKNNVLSKKRKGHHVCPNCRKETFLILHYGKAEYWCRKCRRYFIIIVEKE